MVLIAKICILIFSISIFNGKSIGAAENSISWRDDCRCGENYPLKDGSPAKCNPESSQPCCSNFVDGWCGGTDLHCHCHGCVDYRDPAQLDEEIVEVTKSEALKICYEVEEIGPCQERHRRWWYNTTSRHCQIFYWSGCHSNRNNFKTRYECEHTCFNIENYVNESLANETLRNVSKKPPKKEDKCGHVRCRPGAECDKATGQCVCAKGHIGNPMSYEGCTKNLLVTTIDMELRQMETKDLKNIIEGPFCADLLMTRETEFCNHTIDTGYKDDSTTVQHMECEDIKMTQGSCKVVEEFTKSDNSTLAIKLRITIEEGWLKIPIMLFIEYQMIMMPGILDTAANSLIWLNRAMNSSQMIAIKWDTITIEGENDTVTLVPKSEATFSISDTFDEHNCKDFAGHDVCQDLLSQGMDGQNHLYCHADTGDDLCRRSCGYCQTYLGNETCFNTVDFCRELVKKDPDACITYKADMQILCPYTCDFCRNKAEIYTPGGICDDLNNNCALIRDTYGCGNKYVVYHRQHLQCQKTCGLCDPTEKLHDNITNDEPDPVEETLL